MSVEDNKTKDRNKPDSLRNKKTELYLETEIKS
jgi:hypothetical protein